MFLLRSVFWLTIVGLLLPPLKPGDPAPRVVVARTFGFAPQADTNCRDGNASCPDARAAAATDQTRRTTGREKRRDDGVRHRGTLTAEELDLAWSLANKLMRSRNEH